MNVVLVSPFPPQRDGLAGYTKQLAEYLYAKGHSVSIVRPNEVWKTIPHLLGRQTHVVHVQYTIPAFALSALVLWFAIFISSAFRRSSIVITFHEIKRETAMLGAVGTLYLRLVSMLADRVTVHTQEAASILREKCRVPAVKVAYLAHPLYAYASGRIDPEQFRRDNGLAGKDLVLFFGYIHIDKGIDHLISAFAMAVRHPEMRESTLVVAGSVRQRKWGPLKWFERKDRAYEESLHRLVAKFDLGSRVRFVPYVPDHDVDSWFRAATCVVLPYTNLEQSGVLNIALGCKTPIIASNLGGLAETLAGTEALVPAADDVALSNKLIALVGDDAMRARIVNTYGEICRNRTIQNVGDSLIELYGSMR